MHLAFITDLHIGSENEKPFDIDVRLHFETMLQDIVTHAPDHIIIGGDLCFQTGDVNIYHYVKTLLDETKIPYSLLSGNHDDSLMMAEVFNVQLWEKQLVKRTRMGGVEMFFLDSSTTFISEEQLAWLQQELEECISPVFVFVHHPPLKVNMPYMDKQWPLQNGDALAEILFQHKYNVYVFSGHYHIEKTTVKKNITQFITPSCFVQIDQYAEAFKPDHHVPSWRMIEWNENTLQTTVHYGLKPKDDAGLW